MLTPDPFLSPSQLKQLLSAHGLTPNHELGQHFLIDRNTYEILLREAALTATDSLIEIGPGAGNLTGFLLPQVRQLLAIELDRGLAEVLNARLGTAPNLTLRQADVMSLALTEMLTHLGNPESYKVIANIPYQITSPLLRLFLESDTPPERLVWLVQRDLAERVTVSKPPYNALAIGVQLVATAELVHVVPPGSFWPKPRVDSAILSIRPRPSTDSNLLNTTRELVRLGYSQKRKQLAKLLADGLDLDKATVQAKLASLDLPATARAEQLSPDQWTSLTRHL